MAKTLTVGSFTVWGIDVGCDYVIGHSDYNIVDFRNIDLQAFYGELPEVLKSSEVGRKISPEDLMTGSKLIVQKIATELGITLPENVVQAREQARELLDEDRGNLKRVVDRLNNLYESDKTEGAWQYIREVALSQHDQKKSLAQLRAKMIWIELAVFLRAMGCNDLSITWSQ